MGDVNYNKFISPQWTGPKTPEEYLEMVGNPRVYDYGLKILSFFHALRVNDIDSLYLSWDGTPNNIRFKVLGDLSEMKKIMKYGKQWQKDQLKKFLDQKWKDLDEEKMAEMVKWARKDDMLSGKWVPAHWTGPKSPEQYIEMVSDPESYDYYQ